jgi:hypothetical protein
MARSVWLFARPLSGADIIPPLASLSTGKYHFCHWGVFVTTVSIADLNALLLRTNHQVSGPMQEFDLGVMYELFLVGNRNKINITRPFKVMTVREQWGNASAKYIGLTEMSHDKIVEEGKSRINQC